MKVIRVDNKIVSLENVRSVEITTASEHQHIFGGSEYYLYDISIIITYMNNSIEHIEFTEYPTSEIAQATTIFNEIFEILSAE